MKDEHVNKSQRFDKIRLTFQKPIPSSKKMKIAHVVSVDSVGGVEQLFNNLIAAPYSNESTLENYLIANTKAPHPYFQPNIQEYIKAVYYRKYWQKLKLPALFRDFYMKKVLGNIAPDILLFWNCYHLLGKQKESPYKSVYYDHGSAWYMKDRNVSLFLKQQDLVLACCQASKRMLELQWDFSCPIEVIYNPVREDCIIEDVQAKELPQDRALRLGVAGRLISFKAQCLAIQTLSLLVKKGVDAELYIAGVGPEERALKDLVKSLGISQKVIFLGQVHDMKSFYQKIDIFLSLSIREPFALVVLEAVANGCISIISEVDGLPDFIQKSEAGLCIPTDIPLKEYPSLGGNLNNIPDFVYSPEKDALVSPQIVNPQRCADEIVKLLHSPSRYMEMSRNGIEYIKKYHSFNFYKDEFYKKLWMLVNEKHSSLD
jgi:glycosyltransferase involved in cell wall biosynthesis